MILPYIKEESADGVTVGGVGNYSPEKTFDCGQCFRFEPSSGGGAEGIALGKKITVRREGEDLYIKGISSEEFEAKFRRYLSLDRDHGETDRRISEALLPECGGDIMREAVRVSSGIRILRQDRWETLCSFIVSQNNNIPRIKKIVEGLCRMCGERIGDDDYAFPTAKAVADAGEDALLGLRLGFRASYVYNAARTVAEDPGFLDRVESVSDYAEADEMLRRLKGVGPKVSACTLLFGFGRTDAFPIDVWIRRVIDKYFPGGLDPSVFGSDAGIAQQYLFYYERYLGGADGK